MDLHFYEKLIDYRNRQGMAPQIGAQMTKITEGHAWAELTVQPNQQNLIGSVHGGPTAATSPPRNALSTSSTPPSTWTSC